MRFIYNGGNIYTDNTLLSIGSNKLPDIGLPDLFDLMEKGYEIIGSGVGWTVEQVIGGILALIGKGFKFIGSWIFANLPEIMGYSTIAFGIMMILSSMTKGSIIKPFAWWSGLMIIAIAILGS